MMAGPLALAGQTTVSGVANRITIALGSGAVPDTIAATLSELRDWLHDADLSHVTAGACTHCQHDRSRCHVVELVKDLWPDGAAP
jgi:hypothetical protein